MEVKFIINIQNLEIMKNMFLILSVFLFITGCSEEDTNQLATENATIYYDSSGIDNCIYTIKTDSNNFFTIENINEEFRQNNLRVNISFRKTDNTMNCGFSGNLTIIQIETIEKI